MTRTFTSRIHLLVLSWTCVLAVPLAAHDLWIEPSAFVVDAGTPVGVKLRVGVDLLGDPVARDPALIDRFISVDAGGTKPIHGPDGIDPAGILRTVGNGLVIVGYASKPSRIVLPAEKFNQYLAEEGLDAIVAQRAQRKESQAEAREEFSRCAKALLSSGAVTAAADRALGFTLELIAEKNPYALRAGQDLPVRLLYRGQPLGGALVVAVSKRNPSVQLSARSGGDGRVRFRLADPGMWLIKAVHMTAAPAGSESQWSSFWASLTFQMADGAAAPGVR